MCSLVIGVIECVPLPYMIECVPLSQDTLKEYLDNKTVQSSIALIICSAFVTNIINAEYNPAVVFPVYTLTMHLHTYMHLCRLTCTLTCII